MDSEVESLGKFFAVVSLISMRFRRLQDGLACSEEAHMVRKRYGICGELRTSDDFFGGDGRS